MAEGTQLRGSRLDRMAAVDRRVEGVHDEAKPPRAGSCSLPRRSSSLKTLAPLLLARSKIISYVRAWIRHASGTRVQNLHLQLVVA